MRYKLLTTALINALHVNEPQRVGTIWEADGADELEGKALHAAGFVEPTDEKATVLTIAQNRDGEPAAEPGVSSDDPDQVLHDILLGTVPEIKASLADLDKAQLKRLAKLETKGKVRASVADAIAAQLEVA